ncbi:hypothetical protein AV274_0065 [Blastocystis sp. ATCC 50177/Nand II]|uniref:Amino acid transporter transmembrane domain-containing protein n=1 Tax=Blastocystis sp. subtype 1 (strain ATCC 50177 / NandII) TaxID=478820 RepID=A0A196SPS2_BLAHN|nr:hypothetical protein AV274_0065 [Blastocystis sp. ATCC 50177/Nand II]
MPVIIASIAELLEKNCPPSTSFFVSDGKRFLIRAVQIMVLSLITYVVPFFNDVCSFVGGFSFVALSSILPIVIHYSVFKQTMSRKQFMEHLVLFVISCVIMVVASFFSLKELITKVKMGN